MANPYAILVAITLQFGSSFPHTDDPARDIGFARIFAFGRRQRIPLPRESTWPAVMNIIARETQSVPAYERYQLAAWKLVDVDGATISENAALLDGTVAILVIPPELQVEKGNKFDAQALQHLLSNQGFAILRNAVPWNMVRRIWNNIYTVSKEAPFLCHHKPHRLHNASGWEVQGVAQDERFPTVHPLVGYPLFQKATAIAAGGNESTVHAAEHCDIRVNMLSGWHRDRLNGKARSFETLSPWAVDSITGQSMRIYKFLLYIDIRDPGAATTAVLSLIPGSHLREDWPAMWPRRPPRLKSFSSHEMMKQVWPQCSQMRGCDVVMMDQRILHRGMFEVMRARADRILITVGYGTRPSKHMEDFVQGTESRVRALRERMQRVEAYRWQISASQFHKSLLDEHNQRN